MLLYYNSSARAVVWLLSCIIIAFGFPFFALCSFSVYIYTSYVYICGQFHVEHHFLHRMVADISVRYDTHIINVVYIYTMCWNKITASYTAGRSTFCVIACLAFVCMSVYPAAIASWLMIAVCCMLMYFVLLTA